MELQMTTEMRKIHRDQLHSKKEHYFLQIRIHSNEQRRKKEQRNE